MSTQSTKKSTQRSVSALVAALTRSESGKLVAVLTRIFGTHNLGLAEDAVQDVLLKALEVWQADGVPENPAAWLFTAARNKAIDTVRKYRRQRAFAADITPLLESEYTVATTLNNCFRDEEIPDDQLRMMFACCHPAIPREGQIALILKTLCGFTVSQIARAFIASADAIEKRLYRARQAFRENNISLEIPTGNVLQSRLANVLETIYLLFNEAHSASFHKSLTRHDLAAETICLCLLLTTNPATCLPQTNALLALLYFHTSRLGGRTNVQGELILLKNQDRRLWDMDMRDKGIHHLTKAATGRQVSRYHLEAAIAYEHCKAARYEETDWHAILNCYNLLVTLVPSQVILLNRAVVIKELEGPARAIECIKEIPGIDYLKEYYLLHAILGELNMETGNAERALIHYRKALMLVVSDAEKTFLRKKMQQLEAGVQPQ